MAQRRLTKQQVEEVLKELDTKEKPENFFVMLVLLMKMEILLNLIGVNNETL